MTAELETLVVAAYYFASLLPVPARRGPRAKVSDAELVALAVCQAAMGICSDRQFLGLVRFRLPGWFPHLPEQTQYNRRLRGLAAQMVWVQQRLSQLCESGPVRIADGTLLGVANYAGCGQKSEFAGFAAYGYCAAKSRWYWGVRLVLLVDRKGLPVGYTLVPANEREYEPVRELALGDGSEILVADKGLWGKQYANTLELEGVLLHTPDRVRSHENIERERSLASVRLVVESTISNLKCQMRLEDHLAKTPAGLIQRIAQRLLALTIGVLLNTRNGRPPRNLVAYDGR
jgi:hypothetical protein